MNLGVWEGGQCVGDGALDLFVAGNCPLCPVGADLIMAKGIGLSTVAADNPVASEEGAQVEGSRHLKVGETVGGIVGDDGEPLSAKD